MNSTSLRLVILSSNEVQEFESPSDACRYLITEKIGLEDCYAIKTVVNHEKVDLSHDLKRIKEKIKEEKTNKPDIEASLVQLEIKDDPAKKVQRKR